MIAAGADKHDRPVLALGLRLAAMAVLSLVLVLAKLAEKSGLTLTQLVFWRQFVPVCLIFVWLGARSDLARLRTDRLRVHASRSASGLVGIYLVTAGAQALPLAEATVFGFMAPVFAVMLAATWLREQVGYVRWSAVAVGFVGVAIMAGGDSGHMPLAGVCAAIGGAFMVAVTSIQLRDLGRTEDPITTIFWYFLFCSLVLAVPVAVTMPAPDPRQWMILLGAGFLALFGQLFLTASLRFGHVSSVIVMDYSGLGWALLWGWFIFGNLPPAMTWLGAPFIIAAGAVIMWRQHILALRRSSAQATAGSRSTA